MPPRIRTMARSISCACTGRKSGSFSPALRISTPTPRTSASGARPMLEWDHCTGRGTNWYLCSRREPRHISTMSSSAASAAMMTGGQNDYSACTTWLTHKNDAYLLHVYRGRLEYPELRRKVIGLATEHRATTVLIENA